MLAAPLSVWLRAQTNPVVDVFMRAREQASRDFFMMQQLRLQEEWLREVQRQRAELEKIRAESDRLRREAQELSSSRKVVASDEDKKIGQEILVALGELKSQYPDFEAYGSRIAALADHFSLATGSQLPAKSYIEGLYVIAKYASFSRPTDVAPARSLLPPR